MTKPKKPSRKRPNVVSRYGRYRFQTGMVTASLLRRGLPMAQAFDISRELRERIIDRVEISTEELEAELEQLLAKRGIELPGPLEGAGYDPLGPLRVRTAGGVSLVDRSVLLRDLFSAGVVLEPAAAIADEGIGQHDCDLLSE